MADVKKRVYGEKNRFKVGSFTRDTTVASGTQAVTGIGFTPRVCTFFACCGGAVGTLSLGVDNNSSQYAMFDRQTYVSDAYYYWTTSSIQYYDPAAGGKVYRGLVNSFDSDGFTIGWERLGTPSGTLTVIYLAVR